MWDLATLKRLNQEREEHLRVKNLKKEEAPYKELSLEANNMPNKERDYVWKYVPVHMQDKGGYDEGYYYNYCHDCSKKTEHEDEMCCACNAHNPD